MFAWLHKEQLQLNPFWGESVFQCTLRVIVVESASHDARIASTRADNVADPVISRLELCSAAGTMLEIGWNEWECLFVWGWRRLVSFTAFSFTLQAVWTPAARALTDVMERMDGPERIEAAPRREEVSLCCRNVTGHHLSFNHLLEGGATYFWCCWKTCRAISPTRRHLHEITGRRFLKTGETDVSSL